MSKMAEIQEQRSPLPVMLGGWRSRFMRYLALLATLLAISAFVGIIVLALMA